MDSPLTHSASSSVDPVLISDLYQKLQTSPEKLGFQILQDIAAMGEAGQDLLMQFLLERRNQQSYSLLLPDLLAGRAYQLLLAANSPRTIDFLQTQVPTGLIPLESATNINYQPLQQALAGQDFKLADRITLQTLCELAGETAIRRKWVYFTEVEQLPVLDLQIINALWLLHSNGLFGFSVQRDIWLSTGKNWDKLWEKIGWRTGNLWTRYPGEFIWDLTAPRGHLPLSNQLRGVRVIASLLAHPAWDNATLLP